jgi:hypothetical protein
LAGEAAILGRGDSGFGGFDDGRRDFILVVYWTAQALSRSR